VYVCDRVNDRMQVFTKQGKFVKEFTLRTQTLGMGSVWQFAFSIDENQKFLFVDDGENNVIWTVRREDGGGRGSDRTQRPQRRPVSLGASDRLRLARQPLHRGGRHRQTDSKICFAALGPTSALKRSSISLERCPSQAKSVGDDGDGAEAHRRTGEHGAQQPAENGIENARGDGNSDHIVEKREAKVLLDVANRGAAQFSRSNDSPQVAIKERDAGRFRSRRPCRCPWRCRHRPRPALVRR